MKTSLKKTLAALLSLSMAAGMVVLPSVTASADATPLVEGDTVLQEWKFNFTSTDDADAINVEPTRNYITQTENAEYEDDGTTTTKETSKYGFIGIDEDAYRVTNRYDGFGNQKGQIIPLTQTASGIGVTGGENDKDGNQMDKYYPTRFALKVGDEKYFRVKATVTTLDSSKSATASLYTERKHPIFVDETIEAGETKEAVFSIRTTPIYYQKSDPQGAIKDEMVNVCVLGENTALRSLEIQEVSPFTVFWVLGDSTVTDGNCDLPFIKQQNYTGVGTGLTMYLPTTMAMVNEGEGGLAAGDSLHYDMVVNRIKEGDYLYVQYGHNQNSTSEYKTDMEKYYTTCNSKGAKLLVVSQIERINTWKGSAYDYSARGYATAAEEFVAAKRSAGATDIAYIDDNKYTLAFYNKITTDNGGDREAIGYYFRCPKGGKYSGTDKTHPNDAGSENLAYQFMQAAKEVSEGSDTAQKAIVDGFLTGMQSQTPKLVPEEITSGGLGGTGWPTWTPATDEQYPVAIKNVKFDSDGNILSSKAKVQLSLNPMVAYGVIVVTIYDENGDEKGKLYATRQVDNSTGYGPQTVENFKQGDPSNPVYLEEGDTYKAIVLQGTMDGSNLIVDENADGEGGTVAYSREFDPELVTVEDYLLPGELGDTEDFDMYNQTDLCGSGVYIFGGSAGHYTTLGVEGTGDSARHYTRVERHAGSGNSWWLMRRLENLPTKTVKEKGSEKTVYIGTEQSGTYSFEADLKYVSGYGMNFGFGNEVSPNKSPFVGTTFTLFTVNSNGSVSTNGESVGTISSTDWTHIKYVLNMDAGTVTVKVGDGDEKTMYSSAYATYGSLDNAPSTLTYFYINATANGEVLLSNMTAAKLPDTAKETLTINQAADTLEKGTAYIVGNTLDALLSSGTTVNENTVSVTLKNTTSEAAPARLIVASYTDGAVSNVSVSETSSIAANAVATLSATKTTDNYKVMLWDGLDTMKPLETLAPSEDGSYVMSSKTYAAATNVSVKAVANDGYVFAGWKLEDGTIYSMEPETSLRLYRDTDLTAVFVDEKHEDDIKNYTVTPNKTIVKKGESVTFKLDDFESEDGIKIFLNESDLKTVQWTPMEGVTFSGNTATITNSFDMGGDDIKDVTFEVSVNGEKKTATVKVSSYVYYEDFSGGVPSNWTASNAEDLTVVDDAQIGGKMLRAYQKYSSSKDFNVKGVLPQAISDTVTVDFDVKLGRSNTGGNKQDAYVALRGTGDKEILKIALDKDSASLYLNDNTASAFATPTINTDTDGKHFGDNKNYGIAVLHVTAVVDTANHEITLTVLDKLNNNAKLCDAQKVSFMDSSVSALTGFYGFGKKSLSGVGYANITIKN